VFAALSNAAADMSRSAQAQYGAISVDPDPEGIPQTCNTHVCGSGRWWGGAVVLGACVLGAAAVAYAGGAGGGWFASTGAVKLRVEDWYTTDRCTMYAFFQDVGELKGDDSTLIAAWKESYEANGWKTVVLNKAHAEMHPEYAAMIGPLTALPTVNAGEYDLMCYLRHLAMGAVGGGFLVG